MKIIKYYIIPVVFVIIMLFLVMAIFDFSFFAPVDEEEMEPIAPKVIAIDPKVMVGDAVIDFTRTEELLTVAELIAATGKILRNWDFVPQDRGNWYDEYIKQARVASWIVAGDYRPADYERSITKGEAIRFFIRVLESQGEDRYPVEFSFYRDAFENMKNDVSVDLKEFLVKAYSKGLFSEEIVAYNPNDYMMKEEALLFLDRMLNHGKRIIPMLLLPQANAEFSVSSFHAPRGIYFATNSIKTLVEIKNEENEQKEYWIGLSFQDAAGKWYDVPAEQVVIPGGSRKDFTLTWKVPETIMSGHYRTVMAIWDRKPGTEGARRLAHGESGDLLLIYNNQENFKSLDKELWSVTSGFKLGRSDFKPENVYVDNAKLNIFIPANGFASGELQSVALKGYGSYEICMQLPDAPGSITGFFMYKQPDYYFEIDIEIYNQKSGDYFFTTYAEGKQIHEYFGVFPFDPTAGFHNYRFDYYPDRLDYYVDGEFIVRYTDGYPTEPMHLIVNSWYPNWVPGGPASEDRYFLADWIRY